MEERAESLLMTRRKRSGTQSDFLCRCIVQVVKSLQFPMENTCRLSVSPALFKPYTRVSLETLYTYSLFQYLYLDLAFGGTFHLVKLPENPIDESRALKEAESAINSAPGWVSVSFWTYILGTISVRTSLERSLRIVIRSEFSFHQNGYPKEKTPTFKMVPRARTKRIVKITHLNVYPYNVPTILQSEDQRFMLPFY